MKTVTRNEVDFSEIFEFAEEKFNVGWNRANDMFFNHSLNYKSHNEYSLDECLDFIDEDKTFDELSEEDKGYYIINEFIKDKKVDNIWINNN